MSLGRAPVGILAGDFNDPTNERLIYMSAAGLVVVGLGLLVLTLIWWRRGRQEHPALAPLEVMGSRAWANAPESDRRRKLEQVRVSGAAGAVEEPIVADPVDLEALVRSVPEDFDDLREPSAFIAVPAVANAVADEPVAADPATDVPVAEVAAADVVAADDPVVDVVVAADEPVVDVVVADEPVVDVVVADEPVADVVVESEAAPAAEPVEEVAVVEPEPEPKKPASKKPASKKSASKKSASKKPDVDATSLSTERPIVASESPAKVPVESTE